MKDSNYKKLAERLNRSGAITKQSYINMLMMNTKENQLAFVIGVCNGLLNHRDALIKATSILERPMSNA